MTLEELIDHEEKESKVTWNGKPTLCAEEHRQLAKWLKDYKRLLEQEPCDDTISRQAAIKAICRHCTPEKPERCLTAEICHSYQELKALPPVKPAEKIGYWTNEGFCGDYICSVCKNEIDSDIPNMRGFNFELPKFCPNCGYKMREVKL